MDKEPPAEACNGAAAPRRPGIDARGRRSGAGLAGSKYGEDCACAFANSNSSVRTGPASVMVSLPTSSTPLGSVTTPLALLRVDPPELQSSWAGVRLQLSRELLKLLARENWSGAAWVAAPPLGSKS